MSQKCDELSQVRVEDDNRVWMEQYRNLLGVKATFTSIANMLMRKGRQHMPMPEAQPQPDKLKKK